MSELQKIRIRLKAYDHHWISRQQRLLRLLENRRCLSNREVNNHQEPFTSNRQQRASLVRTHVVLSILLHASTKTTDALS